MFSVERRLLDLRRKAYDREKLDYSALQMTPSQARDFARRNHIRYADIRLLFSDIVIAEIRSQMFNWKNGFGAFFGDYDKVIQSKTKYSGGMLNWFGEENPTWILESDGLTFRGVGLIRDGKYIILSKLEKKKLNAAFKFAYELKRIYKRQAKIDDKNERERLRYA